jgi:hypothetical protein
MLVGPGKHRLKVTLEGYRDYETEINPVANEKSRMKIVLEKETIRRASPSSDFRFNNLLDVPELKEKPHPQNRTVRHPPTRCPGKA